MFNLKRDHFIKMYQPRQTLFHFLKKNKKQHIQSLVNHSKISNSNSSSSNIQTRQNQPNNSQQIIQPININQKNNLNSAITPKKVDLGYVQQKKKLPVKTFIDEIPPLRNRYQNIAQLSLSDQQNIQITLQQPQPQPQPQPPKKPQKSQQSLQRQQLDTQFNKLKKAYLKYLVTTKNLKQQFYNLFIQLSPILKLTQQHPNKQIIKKLINTKQKMKLMQQQFTSLSIQNGKLIMQSFENQFKCYLTSFPIQSSPTLSHQQTQNPITLKPQKDIQTLQHEKQLLQKTITSQNKQIQQLSQYKKNNLQTLQSINRQNQTTQSIFEDQLKLLTQRNKQLSSQVQSMKQQQKCKHQQLTDIMNQKTIIQQKLTEQLDTIKSARQSSFLSEFADLKQQFHNNMKQLTELYLTKQIEYKQIIQSQRKKTNQILELSQSTKSIQQKTIQELQTHKKLIIKYKKQNATLINDMHRINQQLYQHWFALKQIKILANTSKIFHKFQQIYDRIPFNDHLFS